MGLFKEIKEDWRRIGKWFTEVKNFLLFSMLLSAFLMSVIWLYTVQIVSLAVIIGIVAMVSLIGTIVGNYAYVWYIHKQSREKDEKIANLSAKLRETEDENLVLKTKLEKTMTEKVAQANQSEAIGSLVELMKNLDAKSETISNLIATMKNLKSEVKGSDAKD